MNSKESKLYLSEYLDVYGNLLNNKSYEMLRQYYDEDLSLNEIAESFDMTRQGVRDAIIRAQAQLTEFNETLHFVELRKEFLSQLSACKIALESGDIKGGLALIESLITETEG